MNFKLHLIGKNHSTYYCCMNSSLRFMNSVLKMKSVLKKF